MIVVFLSQAVLTFAKVGRSLDPILSETKGHETHHGVERESRSLCNCSEVFFRDDKAHCCSKGGHIKRSTIPTKCFKTLGESLSCYISSLPKLISMCARFPASAFTTCCFAPIRSANSVSTNIMPAVLAPSTCNSLIAPPNLFVVLEVTIRMIFWMTDQVWHLKCVCIQTIEFSK